MWLCLRSCCYCWSRFLKAMGNIITRDILRYAFTYIHTYVYMYVHNHRVPQIIRLTSNQCGYIHISIKKLILVFNGCGYQWMWPGLKKQLALNHIKCSCSYHGTYLLFCMCYTNLLVLLNSSWISAYVMTF